MPKEEGLCSVKYAFEQQFNLTPIVLERALIS
jgi:hypothetical protein